MNRRKGKKRKCSNCHKEWDLKPQQKRKNEIKFKLFNDPVHGSMMFHPALVAIVDTPEFQRLRDIKQLGAVYYVYPGASHNRYEHSLGVCHVAGELLEHLKKIQPELQIQDEEILMVQIAGLCHDLGHGPFSHTFDQKFMPAATGETQYEHEDISLAMFDHLLETHKEVKNTLKKYKIDEEKIRTVKALIHKKNEKIADKYLHEKHFLFEIVANKRNGVDVDKWDYFKRDMYHLGMKAEFDHTRMMKFYRVINIHGTTQICSRDKEAISVYELFTKRQIIHRRACQHRVSMAVEAMIVNGLLAADKFIKFRGKDDRLLTMSECAAQKDMVAFTKLTDSVFYQILASDDPNLESAQVWLRAVQHRKIYRIVTETGPMTDPDLMKLDNDDIKQRIIDHIPSEYLEDLKESPPFKYEHSRCPIYRFIVLTKRIDYGQDGKNPVDRFTFYKKTGEENTVIIKGSQISSFLPQSTQEINIMILLRPTDDEEKDKRCHQILVDAHNKWFEKTFPEFQSQTHDWNYSGYEFQ